MYIEGTQIRHPVRGAPRLRGRLPPLSPFSYSFIVAQHFNPPEHNFTSDMSVSVFRQAEKRERKGLIFAHKILSPRGINNEFKFGSLCLEIFFH